MRRGEKKYVGRTRVIDISGIKYGNLTAIRFIRTNTDQRSIWLFKCDCGAEKEIIANNVKTGATTSCGCAKKGKRKVGPYNHADAESKIIGKKYTSYKNNAARRNLNFELDFKSFKKICTSPCYYCNSGEELNGVDRIDNSIGYIDTNVCSCCTVCNMAKGQKSYLEFLSWVRKVYENKLQ